MNAIDSELRTVMSALGQRARKAAAVLAYAATDAKNLALTAAADALLAETAAVLAANATDVDGAVRRILARIPRVVLVTGSADSVPEGLSAAGVLVVRKPFEMAEIVEVLTRVAPG